MILGETITFSYTGFIQEISLNPGIYSFEAWGASGAGNLRNSGEGSRKGYGGYTRATFCVMSKLFVYILCGGQGSYSEDFNASGGCKGGYNGGGSTVFGWSGSGGGATDFRLAYNKDYLDKTSLNSRFLVAGGRRFR